MSIQQIHTCYQPGTDTGSASTVLPSNWNGRGVTLGASLLIFSTLSLLISGAKAYGSWAEQECGYDITGNHVCWLKDCHLEEVCTHFFGFSECHLEKVCYD